MATEDGEVQPGNSDGVPPLGSANIRRWKERLKNRLTWEFIVQLATIIALALSVVALVLTWRQFGQAETARQESEKRATEAQHVAKQTADQYEKLAKSVSTKYVDVFPKNMGEINELIKATRSSLTVITDVAAYGHFSSPSKSHDYVSLLRELSFPDKKIKIKLLCYNWEDAKNHLVSQFGDFDKVKSSEEFTLYKSLHQVEPQTLDGLANQINDAGKVLLDELKDHKAEIYVTRKELKEKIELPIFMWIRDDEEAIFSMHNYGQSPREDSFRTSDPYFIKRLKQIADEDFDVSKSQPYEF